MGFLGAVNAILAICGTVRVNPGFINTVTASRGQIEEEFGVVCWTLQRKANMNLYHQDNMSV